MKKPFEERFTAWIDDALSGDELIAFERELALHPEAETLRREKRGVRQLRVLLREHLPAAVPALGNNADFFNHQLRERLAAETRREELSAAAPGKSWGWLRPLWAARRGGESLAPGRLLAAGAVCLLVAALGTLALIPARTPTESSSPVAASGGAGNGVPVQPQSNVPAINSSAPVIPGKRGEAIASASPAAPDATPSAPASDNARTEIASLEPSRPDPQLNAILTARVPQGTTTSATAVHFDDQNADVIWLDGLDEMQAADVEGNATPAAAAPKPDQP